MGGGDIDFDTIVEGKSFWGAIFVETFFCGLCQEVLVSRCERVECLDRDAQGGNKSFR